MAEYAREGRVTSAIRFCQELIGSVPSIVVGLFGLALFVNATHWGFTALGGALALTVFNLPLMSRLAEQAIRAVPDDERQASLALGTSKWRTIVHVVLPIAIPGIVTGIVLTAGRIFGEAAALLFTAGLSTPVHYDFGNLNLDRRPLAVEPLPRGDDPVGVHLEDQLGGPGRLRAPDRRHERRPSSCSWSSSSTSERAGSAALLQRRVTGA